MNRSRGHLGVQRRHRWQAERRHGAALRSEKVEATTGIEPVYAVLQTYRNAAQGSVQRDS